MNKKISLIVIAMICSMLVLLGIPMNVQARVMNVQKTGSLTIHKQINPQEQPSYLGYDGFQGDGTSETGLTGGKPLPDVEFSVYGKLTEKDLEALGTKVGETSDVLSSELVASFIKGKQADYIGVTNEEGIVTFKDIPVDTTDLANNMYLVVETKLPGLTEEGHNIVQEPAKPVIVNIPSVNPKEDKEGAEVNNYLYDVNIFMKNYDQEEPKIVKDIDKTTHGKGEEIKYTLTIESLPTEMDEFQELIVSDKLNEKLKFSHLGHSPGYTEENHVMFYNGTTKETLYLDSGVDYIVETPNPKDNGELIWTFTPEGIKKLKGIEAGDESYIQICYSAFFSKEVHFNEIIPNTAMLDFVNKWGYGTKPTEGKPTISPKPSNTVNTVLGDPWFEKSDKSNPDEKLQGAEFLVRNISKLPVTAYNDYEHDPAAQLVTYPAGTELYAVIKGSQVVGWTPSWKEAVSEGWLLVSGPDGRFNVGGLEFSKSLNYRMMYTFMVIGTTEINGTKMEYVKGYENVLASKRVAGDATQAATTQKEIEKILAEHPGDASGDGAWRFYRESEADPIAFDLPPEEMIDSLGDTVNNYEIIEVKPPDKYTPLEVSKEEMNLDDLGDMGVVDKHGNYIPGKDMQSHFTHPLAFTVPGGTENWNIGVPGDMHDITNAIDTPIIIPNVKKPLIPLIPNTGNKITFILIIVGLIVVIVGLYYKRKAQEER